MTEPTITPERLRVDARSAGLRLDLFLARYFMDEARAARGLSRAAIQKLIAEGRIALNGAPAKASARVKAGDRIEVALLPARASELRP